MTNRIGRFEGKLVVVIFIIIHWMIGCIMKLQKSKQ